MSASESQLDSFLQYYRQKLSNTINDLLIPPCLDTFEGERIEWQQEAEKLRIVLERIHSQESELVGKKHEIAEIQKIISDARLAVHDER
jgi:hypothetical protein